MAALLVVGVVLYGMAKYLSIARIGDLPMDGVARGEPANFLIVGSDEREGADEHDTPGHRGDVVMVARLEPGDGAVSVLSIPRDLVLPIAGTGTEDRINAAYAVDRGTLVETVRREFGIELHHYVEVDFNGFEELVDVVGGVHLWVEAALRDERTGLFVDDLGCVELDGGQALAFVRSRELQYMTPTGWSAPDPSADLGRTERQQVFMANALAEVASQVRADPSRLPALVDAVVGAVAIDDQLSIRDLMAVADALSGVGVDDLRTYSLPVTPRSDGATVELEEGSAQPVLDHFRGRDPAPGTTAEPVPGGTEEGGDSGDGPQGAEGTRDREATDGGGSGSDGDDTSPGDHRPEETSNLLTDEFVPGALPGGTPC